MIRASRLPGAAQWVTVDRVRLKDGIEPVWWFGRTPHVKANNRRVLWPYSQSYRQRLAHPRNSKRRTPSGHPDELAVLSDVGGSIPPNLLAMPHSASAGRYLRYCREHGIDPHPARYPPTLPESSVCK